MQIPAGSVNLTASVLAGTEDYDSERLVVDNIRGAQTATATFDNNFVSASLNAQAAPLDIGGLQVLPSAMLTYTASGFSEYTEIGAVDGETGTESNITVASRTAHTLDARAQLEIDRDLGPLDATFRFGIDSRFSKEDDITIRLADGTSSTFAAPGNDPSLGGFVGVRATLAQSDQLQLVGDMEYQFAKGDEQALAASLGVNFSF